jgi:hypothetical protein
MKPIRNSYPIWREAKVINTTDPEELGRAQLKVYPELSEISDADCPWCFPHTSGVHDKSFGLPLVGKKISCVVWNRYWNEITFLPFSITNPTGHLFDDWMKNQRPEVADMEINPEEEHLVVEQFEDDFSMFHDTKNNQHGFLHSTGIYGVINKDGSVWFQSIKKFTFHNKDSSLFIEADSDSGNITVKTKGNEMINITQKSEHSSADTDIHSKAPIGVKGTETQLGGDVLQLYWNDEMKTWNQYPSFIPPGIWPPGSPVPPAPPLINMALNGIKKMILEADANAKKSCALALK